MKKKLEENCNFPKNEKLQFSSSFFHFFFILFSFVFIFLSFFYHSSSCLLPVVQKFSKKWKITIFLEFFHFFYHFFIIFASSGGIDEK